MTLTYLPCIIGNLFGYTFGMQSMCFRGWCSWAEQSLKYKERAPCSFPKGTSEWGVTGHQPIVFNSDLYHKQYWACQLWVRKEHSFILSNYFYQPVKIPIWRKIISGNCVLWFIRRRKNRIWKTKLLLRDGDLSIILRKDKSVKTLSKLYSQSAKQTPSQLN